jgi:simple sugar transport system permease protein
VTAGRVRGGWRSALANAAAFVLLAGGTQLLARQSFPWDPASWALPWSGDVVLVFATLLFLGLAFAMPLQAGVLNLGIYAQFLAGFGLAAAIMRAGLIEPAAGAALLLAAGAGAGAFVGAVLLWLKWRFAVHEALSGLLLGGALVPLASAAILPPAPAPAPPPPVAVPPFALPAPPPPVPLPSLPGLGLGPHGTFAGAILVLALGLFAAFAFAHVLRASSPGFDLRIVGSSPLAAVAAGVDVDLVQLAMLACGGAAAGLTGALQMWTHPSLAFERWPLPLAFAGLTVAVYGLASVRGVVLASALFALWIVAPGTNVSLTHPGWGAAATALLLLPALWTLPRLLPDQGAPRSLWRTRHRQTE